MPLANAEAPKASVCIPTAQSIERTPAVDTLHMLQSLQSSPLNKSVKDAYYISDRLLDTLLR